MTIFITGCSSGIGLATAQLLHDHGHQIYAGVRKPEDAQVCREQGFTPIIIDVNSSASIQQAVAMLAELTEKKLDGLVNNAGFAMPGAVEDLSREHWRQQFETNVFGLQALTAAIIPWMRAQGHGRIVNISSILGLVAMPFRGAYCASKHAVEGLSKALRMELAPANIQVSLIQPGPIKSAFRKNASKAYAQSLKGQQSHYAQQYDGMLAAAEKNKDKLIFTLAPTAVAKKIEHALTAKKPKANYLVTLPAYLLMMMNRLLPARLRDRLIQRIANIETEEKA